MFAKLPRSAFIFLFVASVTQIGWGQYPGRRPAISSYLNNYVVRPDSGLIDRYNAYQRPDVMQQREFATQNARIGQMNQEIRQFREQSVSATGVVGSFMNYSHFFPKSGNSAAPSSYRR